MENEKYAPSFGENEELEFDVYNNNNNGKLRAINITGPGGAPLKGFIFDSKKQKNKKKLRRKN